MMRSGVGRRLLNIPICATMSIKWYVWDPGVMASSIVKATKPTIIMRKSLRKWKRTKAAGLASLGCGSSYRRRVRSYFIVSP